MAKKSLEKKIECLEAIHAIQNVMGRYEYLLSAGRPIRQKIVDLFSQKTPDVSANVGDWGVYKGIDGIRRLFAGLMGRTEERVGFLSEFNLTTPVIEVAGDGKTAKAVWMGPGIETFPDVETGEVRAGWCWTKYACDFIKEDGAWKIWHFNNFLTFYVDYDKSWAEAGDHYIRRPGSIRQVPAEFKPDGPPTIRINPYNPKDTKREFLPAPPEPYETYDPTIDWMDPQKPSK